MKTVFIVTGTTGEYSDAQNWTVRAFSTREYAVAFAEKANAWLKAHHLHDGGPVADWEQRDAIGNRAPGFDANLCVDYTGSAYAVIGPVPLDEMPADEMFALRDLESEAKAQS